MISSGSNSSWLKSMKRGDSSWTRFLYTQWEALAKIGRMIKFIFLKTTPSMIMKLVATSIAKQLQSITRSYTRVTKQILTSLWLICRHLSRSPMTRLLTKFPSTSLESSSQRFSWEMICQQPTLSSGTRVRSRFKEWTSRASTSKTRRRPSSSTSLLTQGIRSSLCSLTMS